MQLTKFNMPQHGSDIVRRKKLEQKLSTLSQYKFAYLSAPAGYGKTTAVVDYVTKEHLKCAWVSLDADDNDPMRFWINVIAAISRCNGKDEMQISLNMPLITSKISMDLLINTIKTIPEEFVIVIDDYHLICNEVILSSVEYFVKNMPQNVSLIMISRKEPDEMVSLLQAKGKALCLNKADFAFDYDDIVEFFTNKGLHFSEKEMKDIYEYSEGWAAALVGAFLYFKDKEMASNSLTALSAKGKNIHALFKSEVFSLWPDDVKNFLVKTSFLDRFCGPLCDAVTENQNSANLLESLAKYNSFVIALDAENKWFRYHHLFQEFLQSCFESLTEEQKCRLYCLAGEWFAQAGMKEEAIKWLLAAKEYRKTLPLVMDYAYWSVKNPVTSHEFLLWKKWIDTIPEEYYQNEATIFSYYSWIASMNNEMDVAETWINKAWKSFNNIKLKMNEYLKKYTEVAILLAEVNIYIYKSDISQIIKCFDRIDSIDIDSYSDIGEMNWYEASILKTPYGFKGRLEYVKIYLGVSDRIQKYMGDEASYIAVAIAELYYEQNMMNELTQMLFSYMGSITLIKKPGILVPSFILLAKSKLAKGDVEGAFSAVEEAQKLLDRKVGNVWNYHLQIFKAKLYLHTGDMKNASDIISGNRIGLYDDLSCVRESEYIVYARLLMQTKRLDDALILLNRIVHFARKENRRGSIIETLCLIAICHWMNGNIQSATAALEQALSLGHKDGYIRTFVDEREPMAFLLDRFITSNKSGGEYLTYARELLRQTNEYIVVMNGVVQDDGAPKSHYTANLLSSKEIEILKLMANNKSNHEIVSELYLSLNTIKQYNSRIFDKLGVKNRSEAVIKAKNLGIIE